MRLAVMNPHMRADYSGPTVFMNRLFGQIASYAGLHVTAVGPQLPNVSSDVVSYKRVVTPDLRSVHGQMIWVGKSLGWLLKNHRSYDLVHFHGAYIFNLICALVPLLVRKPFVILPLSAGGDLRVNARSNQIPFMRSLKKFIVKRSRAAFALSDKNASELHAWGMPESRVVRIHNPASDDFFRTPEIDNGGTRDMLFIGKIGAGKRPYLVIEALACLRDRGWDNATLTLIGPFESDAAEKEVRGLVDQLGVQEAVKFTGYVSSASRFMVQLSNAVFVLPSSQEGLPGALTESMAMGIPAVVTEVGSMGDVVRASRCGSVVAPEAKAIAAAIEELWMDENVWLSFATAAHSYAKIHFSETAVAKKYLASLELGES